MNDNNGTKLIMAFLAGAAAGLAVGYFLNSDKKDELLSDLKEGATKLKSELGEQIGKAQDLLNHLKNTTGDEPSPENQA